MNGLSINEVNKLIKEMSKNTDNKSRLMTVSWILLIFFTYVTIAYVFARFQLYFLLPFSYITDALTSIGLSIELARNAIVFSFIFSLFFTLSLLSIIWQELIMKFFIQRREYKWDIKKGLVDWDFQGNVVIDQNQKAIHIIQSDLGCILRGKNWRNFEMTFEVMIPDPPSLSSRDTEGNRQLRRGFGIIYRAKQLGQYYMLKIDENGCLPHIRNIYWENNGTIWKPKLNVSDLNKWIPFHLTIIDNYLNLKIKNEEFSFLIPTHSVAHRESTFPKEHTDKLESLPFSPVAFRNSGSIGFRSAPLEEIYIRKLKVKEESISQLIKRKFQFLKKIRQKKS